MQDPQTTLFKSGIKSLKFLHSGKVRDIFDAGYGRLLVVQTDRLSAFDVVMEDPIPGKGEILTEMSRFWFKKLRHVVSNHLLDHNPLDAVTTREQDQVRGRAMIVLRCKPLSVEAIVRGYIIGSGWKDYQETGMVCGIELPHGLQQAEKLPEVLFTPSTKAPAGQHDQNITFAEAEKIIGSELAAKVRDASIQLYTEAAEYALTKGIIIADTKFEFGIDGRTGKLYLIDEALTPDSSRFWPADQYRVGISPPSFDKQFVRDWLEQQPWDKKAPAPRLPADIIAKTAEKYREAQQLLIG